MPHVWVLWTLGASIEGLCEVPTWYLRSCNVPTEGRSHNQRFQILSPNLDPYPLLSCLCGLKSMGLTGIWSIPGYIGSPDGPVPRGHGFDPRPKVSSESSFEQRPQNRPLMRSHVNPTSTFQLPASWLVFYRCIHILHVYVCICAGKRYHI